MQSGLPPRRTGKKRSGNINKHRRKDFLAQVTTSTKARMQNLLRRAFLKMRRPTTIQIWMK
jgi:hypothetical protein